MHPATQNLLRWLKPNPQLPERQRRVAEVCESVAEHMTQGGLCAEGAELSTGLRKLLEAKDCFVRASLEAEDNTSA